MALENHINQLKQKHQELESRLEDMLQKPSVGDIEIADIKRQKLQIKDKIVELNKSSDLN